jgi:hypothetical protein
MTIRTVLARFALLAGLLALMGWPASASAVDFTGPTNFFVSPENLSAAALQDIAVADFNGDGDPDLATVYEDDDKVSILLGGAGGAFTGPTNYTLYGHANPLGIAVGDFNGDGDPDLATANEGSSTDPQSVMGGVSVLLGGAGGTFSSVTNFTNDPNVAGHQSRNLGIRPQAVAVGDFNADSDPDLAVADLGTSTGDVAVLLGGAGGDFGNATLYPANVNPRGVGIADFNGDSDPDIVIANAESNNVSVFLGVGGGGTFGSKTDFGAGINPHAVAVGDFNADSDPDIVVANENSSSVSVLVGGSGGTFGSPTGYATGILPDAVVVGNLDGDSDPDLAVPVQGHVNGVDKVTVLLGGAGATFGSRTDFDVGNNATVGEGPTSAAVADFNADSYQDLAVTTEISSVVSILLGTRPYERPIAASPIRVPLVPAFGGCTSANSTHGPPLNFPSCNPPVPGSTTVKSGTGSIGSVWIIVCNTGAAAPSCNESTPGFTPAMRPDLRIFGAERNVQCRLTGTPSGCSTGSDYNPNGASGPYTTVCTTAAICGNSGRTEPLCAPGSGSSSACVAGADITLAAGLGQGSSTTVDPSTQCGTDSSCLAFASKFVGHGVRMTDSYNCKPGLPAGDPNACPASASTSTREATLVDIQFPVPLDCIVDPEGGITGSNCGVNTTANAIVPGLVISGKKVVVEFGEIQLFDSGPDGVRGNTDDQRFATQGIYLP